MTTAPHLERFVPGHVLARLEREDRLVTEVEGTLCFVDISGFTALSERLAAKGRVGAEELTEVLTRVFGNMLELVAERGGTLLKFGGDALLILFEGPEHAMQAACAAVEMRAALRRATEIPTSVGKVTLRMSVGLHSGWIHLFRLSGTHRELIVAGPASSHVNLMEGTADASEILVSSATRDLLPDGAATNAKGEGWLLKWRSSKATACGVPVHFDDRVAVPQDYMPTALREHLATGAPDSEHRLATVLFIKVVGIDDHIADIGVDVTARALQELIANVTSIADEQEVTFLATDVDANAFKIILVAGVPVTSLDENGKALRAARAIADLTTPFDLELGVNRGHVFSGEVGTAERSTYTIMGDTVNLAARLMAAAPAGSVYATPEVVNGSTTLFETTAVPPFEVKGKSKPVHALALGDETGTRTAREAQTVPFVGRDEELAVLRDAVSLVEAGTGSALAVTGPTGIGKTRTVAEAVDESTVDTIEIRAEPYGAANPYRPFRDPTRRLLRVERGDNDEMAVQLLETLRASAPGLLPLAPLLGDIAQIDLPDTEVSADLDPQFRPERAVDAFVELLGVLHPDPLILVGEDMHWADAASELLIARLAREAATHPWLVIQTCRNLIQQETVRTLWLDPMDDDTMRSLVHVATEATPLHPDVVSAIVTRAGGSPLFAIELLKVARETGDVDSLPTSLDGIVGSQIDSLEPLPRRVLSYLAVLGRSFRTPVARTFLASLGVELDEATRARLSGFLEEEGSDRLQFTHAMVRDTAYEGLPYRRRAALHLKAGHMVLESTSGPKDPVADILGLHFHLGGDHEKAWRYSCIAGDRMRERYANPEAAVQYERALASGRELNLSPEERCEVWAKLGDVREQAGMFGPALDAYRRASRLRAADPRTQAGLLLKRANVRQQSGEFSNALRESTRAKRAVADESDPTVRAVSAQVEAFQAGVRLRQGKLASARKLAETALADAELSGERTAAADATNIIAWAAVMSGDERAEEACRRALALYVEVGDVVSQNKMNANLGFLAYFDGRWDEAIEFYEQARIGAQRIGNIGYVAFPETNIGEVLVNQRRFDEAEERLTDAIRLLRATGEWSMATFAEMLLARITLERGDVDQAVSELAAVKGKADAIGYATVSTEAAIHLADCDLRRGDAEAALEAIGRIMDEGGEEAEEFALLAMRIRSCALHASGRTDAAAAVIDEAIDLARDRQVPYDLAMSLQAKADFRGGADAEAEEEARALIERLGIRSPMAEHRS